MGPKGIGIPLKQKNARTNEFLTKGRNMNTVLTWIGIIGLLGTGWIIGWTDGKQYWAHQYDWINEDLRNDITNCRTTLNQCKKDLADPHHCVSVCVDEFEKYGC